MSKLNGKWNLTVKTYMGDMRSVADFTVNGTALTGLVTDAASGNTANVDNGMVDGDHFSYAITIVTPVGEMTNELAGSINAEGTILTGKSKNAMGEFEFEAVRV